MDGTYHSLALILRYRPWRETDALVTVSTPDKGILDLVVRGAQKPKSKLRGHVQAITLSRIMVALGKRQSYASTAINEESFLGIKSDLNKLTLASEAIKRVLNFSPREEEDQPIFDLLFNFLLFLNDQDGYQSDLLLSLFLYKLLEVLGYQPELTKCSSCAKKEEEYLFDLLNSKLYCPNCRENKQDTIRISKASLDILTTYGERPFSNLLDLQAPKKVIKEINILIDLLYKYI